MLRRILTTYNIFMWCHARQSLAADENLFQPHKVLDLEEVKSAENADEERKALMSLYENTNGSFWSISTNWNTTSSICTPWYGIECDTATGRVTSIQLDYNNLVGELPADLGVLSQLTYFSVAGNSLSGPLRREFANWTQLISFSVTRNSLSGPLRREFANWTKINTFDVSFNIKLYGEIPLSWANWLGIQIFAIDGTSISGRLPAISWPQISIFTADNAQFAGEIPSSLGTLWPSIVTFDVSANNISGILPKELKSWSMIRTFLLGKNSLVGELPSDLKFWPKIHVFNVSKNRLSGQLPQSYASWVTIRIFDVSNDHLNGTLPNEFAAWTKIDHFWIHDNKLTSSLPSSYGKWIQPSTFVCDNNGISGYLPSEYSQWNKTIKWFSIRRNEINSEIPSTWSSWSSIQLFDVSSNKITGSISYLSNWSSILLFNAKNNELAGVALPSSFSNFTHIEVYNVASNAKLGGFVTDAICSWNSLQTIDLSYTVINGPLPACLSNLTELTTLIAAHSNLEAPLPYPLPSKLRDLVIPSANLHGALPALDGASSLNSIILHHNSFRDSIHGLKLHSAIMPNLTTLTLHNNLLHGHLNDLEHIEKLNYLTLHKNKFIGRLPKLSMNDGASLIISNNRLSCRLQEMHNQTSIDFSFVLPGNSFVGPLPSWVQFISAFLYVETGWKSQWLMLTAKLFVYAVVLAFAVFIARSTKYHLEEATFRHIRYSNLAHETQLLYHDARNEVFNLIKMSLIWLFGHMLAGLFLLQPAAIIGSKYYTCGEPILSYLTISQLADSFTAEWLASVGVSFCGIFTATFIIRLSTGIPGKTQTVHVANRQSSIPMVTSMMTKGRLLYNLLNTICSVLIWLSILALANSFTVLYLATYSLPNDNEIYIPTIWTLVVWATILCTASYCVVFFIEWTESIVRDKIIFLLSLIGGSFIITTILWVMKLIDLRFSISISNSLRQALAFFVPIFIGILNTTIIPAISKPFARIVGGRHTFIIMLLSARIMSVLFIPFATVLLMNEGCVQGWRPLFGPCRNSPHIFDSKWYGSSTVEFIDSIDTVRVQLKVSVEYSTDLFSSHDICLPSSLSAIETGVCTRNILWVLIPLYLTKAAFQAFIWPAIILFAASFGRSVGVTSPSAMIPLDCSSSQTIQKMKIYSARIILWVTISYTPDHEGVIYDNEVLLIATYLELTVFIGPFCPLYVLITFIGIATNTWAYRLSLQLLDKNAELSPAITMRLIATYLLFSAFVFVIVTVLFFEKNGLHGRSMVTGVLSVGYVILVAILCLQTLIIRRNRPCLVAPRPEVATPDTSLVNTEQLSERDVNIHVTSPRAVSNHEVNLSEIDPDLRASLLQSTDVDV